MSSITYSKAGEKIVSEPDEKQGYIRDYITNQYLKAKPEEIEARQVLAKRLVEEYGFPKELIQTVPEVRIQKGGKLIGPADIVVYNSQKDKEIKEGKNNQFFQRIDELFQKVKNKYRDVFPDPSEKINLRKDTISFIVSQLKNFNFSQASIDAKGEAFQEFIHAYYRGEKGQFFTPQPVMNLAVSIIDPKQEEKIIDPACGTGGFLVTAMKYVMNKIIPASRKDDKEYIASKTKNYAEDYIRGIDINPRLTRVAKMRMVLEDDGHTGIISTNSLDQFSQILHRAMENNSTYFDKNSFDVLFTNPPFGATGKEEQKTILQQYKLAKKWKEIEGKWQPTNEILKGQVPDILFIERCLEFLAGDGRMAIVLPDGDLTNSTLRYVREFIKDKARILAVVSLPPETFIPYGTGVKASIVFLQKVSPDQIKKLKKQDYSVFMAICEKIGYDIRGRTVYKRNEKGKILIDENGQNIIDSDIPEIINEFKKFKTKHQLNF